MRITALLIARRSNKGLLEQDPVFIFCSLANALGCHSVMPRAFGLLESESRESGIRMASDSRAKSAG